MTKNIPHIIALGLHYPWIPITRFWSSARSGPFSHVLSHIYIYIYINTMAECRSGRKCIAVKWNISDISRVFAWRREISPTDVKYHLTTWNITYQREKSDIAPPLCSHGINVIARAVMKFWDILHSFLERRNSTRLRLVRFNRRYTYNSWNISRISLLPVL